MDSFPAHVEFQRPWRSYQQRVLSELAAHLDDNHLHIIAAPGSGKTVLGLEVVRRLNRPTLILSPTVAIRDQWVDRFIQMFTGERDGTPHWISKNIRDPRFLTVSTYQSLHSVYTGQPEETPDNEDDGESDDNSAPTATGSVGAGREALLQAVTRLGVRTLVLDEAHHLRHEWWKCLVDLKKHLTDPVVVALTATAPFDVSPQEWQRYVDLCGPVDAEISVPELIRQQNLCPHQDYVYMSLPVRDERDEIGAFRRDVDKFVQDLLANDRFVAALESHPCVKEPKAHAEEILSTPGFYSSIAFFLKRVRGRPPRKLLRIIGLSPRRCPSLDLESLEILLTGCLYTRAKSFAEHKELMRQILRDAKRIGAAERRRINLSNTGRIARLLIRSASKLKSIEEIVRIESEVLGPDLRMVVLTDFIRRADFPRDPGDAKPLKRLGVVPIFEQIRRAHAETVQPGILTGTLTVIPAQSQELLRSIAPQVGIDPAGITFRALPHDQRYCEVGVRGADKHRMVNLITRLFRQGGVTVLVGTASLLGEGWDAPSVNALVLASFVGSFMLSNQMRGRAIRTQDGNPSKTANIWHLVCQEEGVPQSGEDLETLTRRFKSFVGVSFTTGQIQSGLGRLGLGKAPFDKARIGRINGVMTEKSRDRARLAAEWQRALESAEGHGMTEQVAASQLVLPRDFVFTRTILALLWQGWFWGLFTFSLVMRSAEGTSERMTLKGLLLLTAVASALAALVALPRLLKALWLFLRHAPVASSMKQIGKALVRSLAHADLIETSRWRLKIVAQRRDYGFVSCSLKGGTTRERSLFLEALQEVLSPIENPRYLLVRKSPLGPLLRRDYHAVPKALGRNKDLAEHFARMWSKFVGPVDLVYTRKEEGRKRLLKARAGSLSSGFQSRSERIRSWQ